MGRIFLAIFSLWSSPSIGQTHLAARPARAMLCGTTAVMPTSGLMQSSPMGAVLALRLGALAAAELDVVGLSLNLPANMPQLPQDAPFYVPVALDFGGKPATQPQMNALVPVGAILQGTLTGPGLSAPVALTGTVAQGISVPGLAQKGDYTISGVKLVAPGWAPP